MAAREERNQDATVYVGQLDDQVHLDFLFMFSPCTFRLALCAMAGLVYVSVVCACTHSYDLLTCVWTHGDVLQVTEPLLWELFVQAGPVGKSHTHAHTHTYIYICTHIHIHTRT